MNPDSISSPHDAPELVDGGSPRAQRIRKLSWLFQMICRVLIGLLVLAAIGVTAPQIQKLVSGDHRGLTPQAAFIPTALFLHAYWGVALWLLERMFHSFARRGVFDPRGARRLKWLGLMFLGGGGAQVVMMILALVFGHGGGAAVVLTDLPAVFGILLLGTTILMFGWVMEEGCELREQQAYTI